LRGQLALELLGAILAGGCDAFTEPFAAHLARNRLFVVGHGGGDIAAIGALAVILESGLYAC
jgi:hypothetical protein